ncbi:MAG: hypothetical protein K2Y37_02315 [Pirellulales bacterium]|nr:hypothetical protein [Pirellulales bacterium]
MDQLRPCPVCGYLTICGEWEGCTVCGWEHSCWQEDDPDSLGPNGDVTLRQAQINFQEYSAADPGFARIADPIEIRTARFQRDPHWKPLPRRDESPLDPAKHSTKQSTDDASKPQW